MRTRETRVRRRLAGVLCIGALAMGGVGSAEAAYPEPSFLLFPHHLPQSPSPPDLQDPCGLAVDSAARLYASNYHRHSIDRFAPSPRYLGTPLSNVDPLDGPCGLAVDSTRRLYVNNYHRNVVRYTLAAGPLETPVVIDSGDPSDPGINPTGVAVDLTTDNVYVNNRTYIAAYDSLGAPLPSGRVGEGSIGDGYGIAVSAFPGTRGFLYVPDWSTNTVKVFDSADGSVKDPIVGPPGGFGSLRDSAIAVDDVTGDVYVVDTLAFPQYAELPRAEVHVFSSTGAYEGRLKYDLVDPSPAGIAVDNSVTATQGRVYVTSGNSIEAGVYAYPPGSATVVSAPPVIPEGVASQNLGGGSSQLHAAPFRETLGEQRMNASSAPAKASVIAQQGKLRVAVSGRLAPKRLPRRGTAPISVSVDGKISTTDQSLPPQLKSIRIELNRHGKLDPTGLPTCNYNRIQPGSSSRALAACRSALVGQGSFTANITLAGQEPYPTSGKLLVFNGKRRGRPVLFGHIFSARPFATSFVIVFKIQKLGKGTYGTALNAPLPKAMDAWGRLTGLQMTLSRRYRHRGERRSFISAGCPAPKGFRRVPFPLARTSFAFAGGKRLSTVLSSTCGVRG